MRKQPLFWIALAFLSSVAVAVQLQATFKTKDGSFSIYGAGEFGGSAESKSYDFDLTGNPARVEALQYGLTMRGTKIEGRVRQLLDDTYITDRLNVTRNAQVVIDSDVSERFKTQQTGKPSAVTEKRRTQVDTDRYVYAGNENEGVLTLPAPVQTDIHSTDRKQVDKKQGEKTIKVWEDSVVDFKVDASKGDITLNPRPKPKEMPLRKGSLEGPITFTIHRVATQEGVPEPYVAHVVGSCDRLVFDFTGAERTVKMIGNVKLDGKGTGTWFAGTFTATEATLTLTETMEIKSFRAKGAPTTETVISTKKGGL